MFFLEYLLKFTAGLNVSLTVLLLEVSVVVDTAVVGVVDVVVVAIVDHGIRQMAQLYCVVVFKKHFLFY